MEGKSSNGKYRKVGDEIDRISGLPEEILHYILSLSILDTKEVVQTSLVSKRWRNLWIASLPYLNFDHSLWKKIEKTQLQYRCLIEELGFTLHNLQTKHKFMEFIDKVLLLPEGPNICKFNLVGDDYCDEDRFGRWFSCLARKHAQEVYINITPRIYYEFPDDGPEPYELPHCLFTSEIKIFKLEVYTTAVNLSYQLPDSICSAAHLKILHLVSARLPKGDSNGELVFNCPCLENFIMVDCDTSHLNILDISTPQLQKLVLNSEYWGAYKSCKVRIMTPSLISFQSNCVFEDYYLENLGCLLSANISLSADNENEAKNAIKFLSGLRNAETLELFFWSKFKASMEIQNMFDQLPHAFQNLKCLKLLMFNDTYINLVANLMKSSPHIEILILEVIRGETTINWGDELSFESKFHQLKSIEIKDIGHCLNPENCGNLFTLLEFLLKNAVALENVRLTHCEELSSDDKDEVNKKLEALPRASSSVTILFP